MKSTISRLENYMNRLEEHGYFTGAVLVGHQGRVLLSHGYGFSNEEHGVPNLPTTKFRIGSITKGFTAMAILQLQEQGLLSVREPVSRYLPDFPGDEQITVHHLLTHTSGIPDFVRFPDYWTRIMRLPSTLDQTIGLFRNLPLEFAPGEQFSYGSSSYLLLTAIIERLSGQSYAAFLKQHIFDPLQMNDTGLDDGRTIVKNLASGYSVWKGKVHAEYVDMSIPAGAYGLYSTALDLYRWDQALYTDQLVSRESLQSMFTPFQANYGYGWAIQKVEIGDKQHSFVSHYGDINGFCGNILRFVDDRLTVIVLSNLSITPVTWIGKNLARLFFGEPVLIPEKAESFDLDEEKAHRLTGSYRIENSDRKLTVTFEKGRLYVTVAKVHGALYQYPIRPVSITEDFIRFRADYIDETFVFRIKHPQVQLLFREMDQTHIAFRSDRV